MSMPDPTLANDILNRLPIAIALVKDETIVWANPKLYQLTGLDEAQVLDVQPQQSENPTLRALFSSATVTTLDAEPTQILVKQEQFILENQHTAFCFTDISEQSHLEQQVAKLSSKDSLTGLFKRQIILDNLASQVTRSRRYGNPLALLRLTAKCPEEHQEQHIKMIAEQLNDRLRWADCLGHLDANTFLLILPETCLEDAKELATKLLNDRTVVIDGCTIQFGIASWEKGDDPNKLLQKLEVDQEISAVALFS